MANIPAFDTIDAAWKFYANEALPDSMSDETRFVAKASFYSGFASFMSYLSEAPETEAAFMRAMVSFHREMEGFKEEVVIKAMDTVLSGESVKH